MTRPDYCPVAQEPCQAMCALSDVRCKIRDTHPQPKREPLTNENPLLVFAKECVLGAYSEDELANAAFKAIEAAHGITSDMKQEYVAKTAKQRHEDNT